MRLAERLTGLSGTMQIKNFHVSYPVFIIMRGESHEDVGIVKMKEPCSDNMTDGLAAFTDDDAAETFRDQHFPGWSLTSIPDKSALVRLLTVLRKKLSWVAFDPYKMGTRPASIRLEELLAQMTEE